MGVPVMGQILGMGPDRNVVTYHLDLLWDIFASAEVLRPEGRKGGLLLYVVLYIIHPVAVLRASVAVIHPFGVFYVVINR